MIGTIQMMFGKVPYSCQSDFEDSITVEMGFNAVWKRCCLVLWL